MAWGSRDSVIHTSDLDTCRNGQFGIGAKGVHDFPAQFSRRLAANRRSAHGTQGTGTTRETATSDHVPLNGPNRPAAEQLVIGHLSVMIGYPSASLSHRAAPSSITDQPQPHGYQRCGD